MNILVTCLSKSWGGMEMFAVSSIGLLLDEGHSVTLACIKGTRIENAARNMNIEIAGFSSGSPGLDNLFTMYTLLNDSAFDIIHSHYTKDLWIIVPALKLKGSRTPLVITKHLGSYIKKKDILHRFIYNRVDHAVAISNVIRDNIIDTTGMSGEKVSVIHNFVDLEKYSQNENVFDIKKEFGINADTVTLGMIGRITPAKGHDDVIEAVNLLKGKNLDFKVIVVGSSQADELGFEMGLKEQIRKYDIDNYFVFAGFRSNVPEFIRSFDIFLFPSKAEAFGLALVEAMAAGLPNIVCYSDGVKDIAIKDHTALAYDRDDIKTLALCMERLICDAPLRKFLGDNSREASANYSPSLFRQKIELLYNSLIKNIRPR